LDNLTHSLFGATLARTPLSAAGRGTTAALLLASNAPDIDILATAGGAMNYLEWHRGPTHGPLGVAGLALITAGLVWIGRRIYDKRRDGSAGTRDPAVPPRPGIGGDDRHRGTDASFGVLVAVSVIGVLLHVLMDLPTVYGTRPLSPFNWRWFALDWMPIVDVYLLTALVIGLLGRPTPAQRRAKAAFVLLLMAINYGVRAASHQQALVLASRLFGPALPPRCDPATTNVGLLESWPRASPPSNPAAGTRCLVEFAAMPSFTSPFRWRIIAQLSNAYEMHDIDLLDQRFGASGADSDAPWRLTLRYPNVWTPAVEKAAATELGQLFLGFSRFPAARSAIDAEGVTTVRWTDVRFAGGPFTLERQTTRANMFTATVRVAPDGRILGERLGGR
jgi:membrane-bound metal-dependent hydrolase YbcI (DUF457 family)